MRQMSPAATDPLSHNLYRTIRTFTDVREEDDDCVEESDRIDAFSTLEDKARMK